jgi:hypothetical protein
MESHEGIAAVVNLGFTERQARFLVLVMQHSGVCLLRQYSAFAGIVHPSIGSADCVPSLMDRQIDVHRCPDALLTLDVQASLEL